MKLIECVPNFSEGKEKNTIKQIADAIASESKLLNVESDPDHNRSVMTFAGSPDQVLKSAYKGIIKAAELIDMSKHKGTHPRIGASDVVPFIPLEGATMEDCISLANELGEEVGKYGIPVYIYGTAAKTEERISQADIRKGQYEGLEEKLKQPEWKPDYGPAEFNSKSGATIIGARNVLIAYNIYLSSDKLELAKDISKQIRESSGGFKGIQAGGMKVDGIAQVSMNIRDYKTTSIATVYDKVRQLAAIERISIIKSEVVGLVPKQAIIDAGWHYFHPYRPKDELGLISKAVDALKIDEMRADPRQKIIEYLVE